MGGIPVPFSFNLPDAAFAFREVQGSPRERYSPDGFVGVRVFDVLHAEKTEFVAALLDPDAPISYPDKDDTFITAIEVEPLDGAVITGTPSFDVLSTTQTYRITVTWSNIQGNSGNAGPDREETLSPDAEFLTLPGEGFFWNDDATDPLENDVEIGVLDRLVTWTIIRRNLTTIPLEVLNLTGSVNEAQVQSTDYEDFVFGPESLLYHPPRIIPVNSIDGVRYTVELPFQYRPDTWNRVRRKGTAVVDDSVVVWKPQDIYNVDGKKLKFYPIEDHDPLVNL